jgi:hypothetical protein
MKKLLVSLTLLFSCSLAHAQSYTGSNTGTIAVSSIINVTLSNLTPSASFTNLSAYLTGLTINNFSGVAVKSNVNWSLTISAQSQYFTPMSLGGSATMPATILGFRENGATTFNTLSTNGQLLKLGTKGNAATVGNTFNIDMSFNPGLNYAGGIYTIGVLYTVTQQ